MSSVESIKKAFGSTLRDLRRNEKHMTLGDVSREIDMDEPSLSRIERGLRGLSLETMQILASFYQRELVVNLLNGGYIEDVCFAVIYGGQIHGVGMDSESAWREAELSLNIERETLKDMGYYMRQARVFKE